ncbi:MAG: hypothetical protein J7K40_02785 [candidate division Zixibacteria bacterium]|nr:hypothetical protein [candidate division Zixibacteria bacterium]
MRHLSMISFLILLFISNIGYAQNPECDYVPGDINGDGAVLGSDVVFGVNYFRGGANPPNSCWNYLTEDWLFSAADANGDCRFLGSDITFVVNYFRGNNLEILWCSQTPPMPQEYVHEEIRGECTDGTTAEADSGYMVLEAIGNDLHIHHMDAFYQCCLEYYVRYGIVETDITATEYDIGELCDCICPFDLESIVYDLPSALYTVRLIGIYGDTIGIDTITVGN